MEPPPANQRFTIAPRLAISAIYVKWSQVFDLRVSAEGPVSVNALHSLPPVTTGETRRKLESAVRQRARRTQLNSQCTKSIALQKGDLVFSGRTGSFHVTP